MYHSSLTEILVLGTSVSYPLALFLLHHEKGRYRSNLHYHTLIGYQRETLFGAVNGRCVRTAVKTFGGATPGRGKTMDNVTQGNQCQRLLQGFVLNCTEGSRRPPPSKWNGPPVLYFVSHACNRRTLFIKGVKGEWRKLHSKSFIICALHKILAWLIIHQGR
jgi:hypothetical protein